MAFDTTTMSVSFYANKHKVPSLCKTLHLRHTQSTQSCAIVFNAFGKYVAKAKKRQELISLLFIYWLFISPFLWAGEQKHKYEINLIVVAQKEKEKEKGVMKVYVVETMDVWTQYNAKQLLR